MNAIIDESTFPQHMMEPPIPPKETTCRNHAPCPEGYLAWQEWARLIAKTHKSERCGECGLWAIRRRKEVGEWPWTGSGPDDVTWSDAHNKERP